MSKEVIQKIETFPLHYPEPHDSGKSRYITIVKIITNEGRVGWGECIAQFPEAAMATATVIDTGLGEHIIGEDPTEVEHIWNLLRERNWWYGNGGIANFAVSAIDMAVWDLKGKIHNLPIYQLLGGRKVDKIRACASIIFDTENLEATHNEFLDFKNRGYTAVKGGWGKSKETAFGLNPERDLKLVETIRDAVGPDVTFALDVGTHVAWTPQHAIEQIKKYEDYDIFWVEEPLPQYDIRGYEMLKASTNTPIASGEKEWNIEAFKNWIISGLIDVVMPDPGKAEGITGFKKVVDFASVYGIGFTPHSWSSAINTAAALHLYTASSNGVNFELKPNPSPMQYELVTNPIEQNNGYVEPLEGPGLGIEIVEEVIEKYNMKLGA